MSLFSRIVLLLCLTMLIQCGGGGSSSSPDLIGPAVVVQTDKATVGKKGKVVLSTGDSRQVTWSASTGSLSATTGSSVVWTAPGAYGDVTISAVPKGGSETKTLLHVIPIQIKFLGDSAAARDAPAWLQLAVQLAPDQGSVIWEASQGSFQYTYSRSTEFVGPVVPGAYQIVARSADDPDASCTFDLTINPQSMSVTPSFSLVAPYGMGWFTAKSTGISGDAYSWSSDQGTLVDPHMPGSMWWQPPAEAAGTYRITARSQTNPSISAEAQVFVTMAPLPVVYFKPPTGPGSMGGCLRILPGQTVGLGARVLNTSDQRIVYSDFFDRLRYSDLEPIPAGALTPSGFFTAPTAPGVHTYVVGATSVVDPSKSNYLNIIVHPGEFTPSPWLATAGTTQPLGYSRLDVPNMGWNWSINGNFVYVSGPGMISASGVFQAPPYATSVAFQLESTAKNGGVIPLYTDGLFIPVAGSGPFTPLCQDLPAGWWDAWLPTGAGNLLIFGGVASKDVYQVDTVSGQKAQLGELRYHHTFGKAFDLGAGKMLLFGGDEVAGSYHRPLRMEIFDAALGASIWEGTEDQMAYLFGRAQLLDGRCVIGGVFREEPGYLFPGIRVFDPMSRTLSPLYRIPNDAHTFSMTVLKNGKLLLVGGYSVAGDAGKDGKGGIYSWDPDTAEFSYLGSMNLATWDHTATELPDGRILILGGASEFNTGGESGAEVFDPATGSSTAAGFMNWPRKQHAATWIDSTHLLITGGYAGGVEVLDVQSGQLEIRGSLYSISFGGGHLLLGDRLVAPSGDSSVEQAPLSSLLSGPNPVKGTAIKSSMSISPRLGSRRSPSTLGGNGKSDPHQRPVEGEIPR